MRDSAGAPTSNGHVNGGATSRMSGKGISPVLSLNAWDDRRTPLSAARSVDILYDICVHV